MYIILEVSIHGKDYRINVKIFLNRSKNTIHINHTLKYSLLVTFLSAATPVLLPFFAENALMSMAGTAQSSSFVSAYCSHDLISLSFLSISLILQVYDS